MAHMARAEAGQGQGLNFVDYRDLSIRHLGSIYEGLLEYRLAYAAEEMVVVKARRGKGEEIVPASEAEKPGFFRKTRFLVERIPAGQVYLVTGRGERKATGSYYTPDYIVKYIVEQTLGPLADAQAEAVEQEIAALKEKNKGAAHETVQGGTGPLTEQLRRPRPGPEHVRSGHGQWALPGRGDRLPGAAHRRGRGVNGFPH